MRFARRVPPHTTKTTVRFGSSLSPAVTSLAPALAAALVAEPASRSAAEPASRPAGKRQPCCFDHEPPGLHFEAQAGGFLFRTAMLRNRFPEQCALIQCPSGRRSARSADDASSNGVWGASAAVA